MLLLKSATQTVLYSRITPLFQECSYKPQYFDEDADNKVEAKLLFVVLHMKFKGPLTESVLLKRHFRFLMEVILKNKKRRTIYCPNLGTLLGCDILGTRLWFSSAGRLSQGYLDILELVEVNEGYMVAVNPDYAMVLVREGVRENIIAELQNYRFLHLNSVHACKGVDLLLKETGEQCYIHIEPIFYGDERGEGIFPETVFQEIQSLKELIHQKEMGHRAVLFYCVQHNGIKCVRPSDVVHPLYNTLLKQAVSMGVEVLAYRATINLREITLESRIPVLLSEDITSR